MQVQKGRMTTMRIWRRGLMAWRSMSVRRPPPMVLRPADRLMELIGTEIAKLHLADIVHGDLTTSNIMARRDMTGLGVVLIDFGLASVSTLIEDKAVDLYVLERALQATHPEPEDLDPQSTRFARILGAYAVELGQQQWTRVQSRLDDVRRRGRKRDMIG